MAQYRQSGHYYSNGASDHVSIGIRASPSQQQYKPVRVRRSGRSDKGRAGGFPIGSVIVFLCLVFVVTVLAYYYLSVDNKVIHDRHTDDDDFVKNDIDFLTNVTRTDNVRVLGFGQGSVHGRDSRYWDKDDRRRDGDYGEDDAEHDSKESRDGSTETGDNPVRMSDDNRETSQEDLSNGLDSKGAALYNENGRNELKKYEEEYEASLKNAGRPNERHDIKFRGLSDEGSGEHNELVDSDNEYDDVIDSHDSHLEEYGVSEHDNGDQTVVAISHDDGRQLSSLHDAGTKDQNIAKDDPEVFENTTGKSLNTKTADNMDKKSRPVPTGGGQSTTKSRSDSKRKTKRRKFSGSCEMKLLNSTSQIVEPFENRKFGRFSLQYVEKEEKPNGDEEWEPRFAGHQSLQEREESFLAHDEKINCGFVKGPEGSPSTGFDLAEDDANYISRCHIAVVSCIFGNSDRLRSPPTKMVTRSSRKNVCFVMFMDELTLQTLSSEGHMPDRSGFIGLWKVVVVKNLPYTDMRRVGKIPKMLPHRLFPSARYSIWLDSKLRLQLDPILVLEYFLWRKGHEYAISNHYDRHCVWEEVAQNKRLNKYDHTVIDQQFNFYQADGLKKFDASDPNKLLPSNVPEGSFIVRAHTPMSNLFSCLWFNEVDRFTPRDQLSFAYTYQKLKKMNPGKPFYLNMFKDCERRAVAKLFRHRSQEKLNLVRQQATE